MSNNCKLLTTDTIIKTQIITREKEIKTYLPKYNITFNSSLNADIEKLKEVKLKVIQNPNELKELTNQLQQVNNEINANEKPQLPFEHFVYPMATSGTTMAIIIIIIIAVVIIKIKKRQRKCSVDHVATEGEETRL